MGVKRTSARGSGDTELAVIDYGGEGPGILLVHGMMGRASTWDSSAAWLTDHGRVIGYDARGHGLSESPDGPYDRKAHLDDAAAVIEAFHLGPAIVIGHSMGGLTAWQLAGTRPDLVRAIVIGDMAAVVPNVQDRWRAWLADWPVPFNSLAAVREYFAGDHFGKYFVGAHPEGNHPNEGDYFIEVFAEQSDGYHPLARTEHVLRCREHWNDRDHSSELDAVTCPALVVAGQHSYFPVQGSREMADRLPDGRFVMIPNAGHVLHYDDPAAWRRAVEPFVADATRR